MYVREIDLKRRGSWALVVARGARENAPVALRASSAFSPEKTPAKTDANA
jgi:hypothetical protein